MEDRAEGGHSAATQTALVQHLLSFSEEFIEQARFGPHADPAAEVAILFDEAGKVRPEIPHALDRMSAVASDLLGRLLPEAHDLRLVVSVAETVQEAYEKGVLSWRARSAGTDVPLERLSSAEARWAKYSIARALESEKSGAYRVPSYRVTIIDEPEMTLHPLAARHLSDALPQLGDRVVVSTHSPAVLETHENLIHVWREDGRTRTADMPMPVAMGELQELAATLGTTSSDLLQLTRVIMLVEGPHDEAVFGTLLDEVLRATRAHILTIEGTAEFQHIATAKWLLRLSTAQVLILVDDVDTTLTDAWEETASRLRSRHEYVHAPLRKVRAETKGHRRKIAELGLDALNYGSFFRLHLSGIDVKDVANLLPVNQFIPDSDSWPQAFKRFLRTGAKPDGQGFKRWVTDQGGYPYTIDGLREVAERVADGDLIMEVHAQRQLERVSRKLYELGGR